MARRPRTASRPGALVPAAQTAARGSVLTAAERDLNASAINTFVQVVGGRQAFIDVLSVADAAPEAESVVNLLLDPRYAGYSIRRLCFITGITVADLFAAYRKACIARAHIRAAHVIAEKLPPIVEDVMSRATPTRVKCPACQGAGQKSRTITGEVRQVTCGLCAGKGWTRSQPDLDRQKLALELGQLTEKKAGLIVQQNQMAVSAATLARTGVGSLESLQQAVGELLFSPARRRGGPGDPPPTAPARTEPPLDRPPPGEDDDPGADPGADPEDDEAPTPDESEGGPGDAGAGAA